MSNLFNKIILDGCWLSLELFVDKIKKALNQDDYKGVAFVGGVACNAYIRLKIKELADQRGLPFFVPSPLYCTDNAAMIAFVGHYKAQQNKFDSLDFEIL